MLSNKNSQATRLASVGLVVGVVMSVAVFGVSSLMSSHAASAFVSSEPETGSLSGGATIISDTTASGSKGVKFGAPAPVAGTSVTTYGAVGDGVTDDQAALAKAFSTAPAGSTLLIPAGKIFKHSSVLSVTVAGLHISGSGTMLASNFADSAVHIQAANVTIDGGMTFKFNTAGQTRQSAGWNTMLWLDNIPGTKLSNITVDGSPSAGVLMYGASFYTLTDVTVMNTLADGIHNTHGSHDGTITRPILRNVGDDGVAVVSYLGDGAETYNITVQSPKLYSQTWGRAFTVVGGHDITFSNVYSDGSNGAAILIAAESSYNTYGVKNVKVLGGTLLNSNKSSSIAHGAILVANGQPTQTISAIDIENIIIQNTRGTAPWEAGILSGGGGGISGVQLRGITVTGGPAKQFSADPVTPTTSYNTLNWLYNGTRLADHQGFTPYP